MILNKLTLKNFKRFINETITFPEGIIGVVGENGAGKSSILEGIVFSLYGVQGTCVDSDFILSSGANPKDKSEISLEFEVNGENYTVYRTFKKAKTIHHEADLYHNDILIASGVSAVADAVCQIIGMNALDLQHTVYAGQNDLKSIISATPSVRRDWFLRVIGVNELKKQGNEYLKDEINTLEAKISVIEGHLKAMEEWDIANQIANQEGRINQIEQEENILSAKYERERENYSTKLTHLKTVEESMGQYNKICGQLETTTHQFNQILTTYEQKQEDLQRCEEELTHIEGLEEQFSQYEKLYQDYVLQESTGKNYNTLINDLNLNKGRLEKNLKAMADLKSDISSKETELITCRESLLPLEGQIESLNTVLAEGAITLSGFEEASTEYLSQKVTLEHLIESLSSLKVQTPPNLPDDVAPYIHDDTVDIDKLDDVGSELQSKLLEVSSIKRSADTQKVALATKMAALEKLEGEGTCPTCNQVLGDHFHETLENMRSELSEYDATILQATTNISNLQKEIAAHQILVTKCKNYADQLSESHTYGNLREKCDQLSAQFKEVQDRYLTLKQVKDQFDKHTQELLSISTAEQTLTHKIQLITEGLENKYQTLERYDQDNADIASRLQILEESITDLHYDPILLVSLKSSLDTLKPDHDLYLTLPAKQEAHKHIIQGIQEIEKQLESLDTSITTLHDELEKNEYDPESHSSLKEEVESILKAIDEVKTLIANGNAEKKSCTDTLKNLRESMIEFSRLEKEKNDHTQEYAIVKMTRNALNGFLDHLLTLIRSTLEDEVNVIISDVTNGRYSRIEITEGFDILVEDITGMYPVSRFSGGEQDVIAVALRIAVSRFIANLHQIRHSTFLIFDEIFGSQDPSRRNNLIQSLRNQEMRFPQILLISHIPDIQEEFGNTIEVSRSSDKTSRVVCTRS
jgi:exonuclease SbcC